VLSSSTKIFRLLADPTRRALLDLLLRSEQSAKDLSSHFRASQQAVSLHLQSLRRAGVVQVRKEGRYRKYRLKAEPIREVYEWSAKYKPFFDPYGHAWLMTPAPEQVVPDPACQAGRRQARRKQWS